VAERAAVLMKSCSAVLLLSVHKLSTRRGCHTYPRYPISLLSGRYRKQHVGSRPAASVCLLPQESRCCLFARTCPRLAR